MLLTSNPTHDLYNSFHSCPLKGLENTGKCGRKNLKSEKLDSCCSWVSRSLNILCNQRRGKRRCQEFQTLFMWVRSPEKENKSQGERVNDLLWGQLRVTREEERFSLAEDWLSSGEKRKTSWWPNVVVINMLNIANTVQCCSLIPPIISFYFARKIGNRCRDLLKPAKIHRNTPYKAKHSICKVFGLTTLIPQHSLSSLGKPSEI